MQKHVNLVDLVRSFPTNIFLQDLALIQKRTSLIKFDHLADKSEKGSISNLSTKTERGEWDNGEQKGKWKKKGSPSTREERQDLGEKEPSTERGDRNNREQKGKDTTGNLGGREEQHDLGEEQKSSVEDDGKSSSTVEKQQKIVKQKIIAALEAWGRSAGQMSAPTPGARTLKSRRAS